MAVVWETVKTSSYYLAILNSMGTYQSGSSVRFGTTGDGIHPNYQIVKNGQTRTFWGISHKLAVMKKGPFEEGNLSRPYEYEEVLALKKRSEANGY